MAHSLTYCVIWGALIFHLGGTHFTEGSSCSGWVHRTGEDAVTYSDTASAIAEAVTVAKDPTHAAQEVSLPSIGCTNCRCLSGSPYKYFICQYPTASRWVIHFQGAGMCLTASDCAERADLSTGSSNLWTPPQCPSTPNVNVVFLKSCDGGIYSGNSVFTFNGRNLHSRGLNNVRESFNHLLTTTNIASSSEVGFVGASSGAWGLWQHLTWLKSRIPLVPHVYGVSIAGWFNPPTYPSTQWTRMVNFGNLHNIGGVGFDLCVPIYQAMYGLGTAKMLCLFPNFITTILDEIPWFVVFSEYDEKQLSVMEGRSCTCEESVIKERLISAQRGTLNGFFLTPCIDHGWSKYEIGGTDWIGAIDAWLTTTDGVYAYTECNGIPDVGSSGCSTCSGGAYVSCTEFTSLRRQLVTTPAPVATSPAPAATTPVETTPEQLDNTSLPENLATTPVEPIDPFQTPSAACAVPLVYWLYVVGVGTCFAFVSV